MLRNTLWIWPLVCFAFILGAGSGTCCLAVAASEVDPGEDDSSSGGEGRTDGDDASNQSTAEAATTTEAVTVLGLGKMGTAVVQCLAGSSSTAERQQQQQQRQVHAWNRGAAKRRAVADIATVHETAQDAASSSNTTLILIDDWPGTVQLLRDIKWREDQTVVVFSTYTPTDIQTVQRELFSTASSSNSNAAPVLVGGAIVGVPQTICSPHALILTSGGDVPVLHAVGRTVAFAGADVGLAVLANMALILVITFGVAGQELALLMVRQYDMVGSTTMGNSEDDSKEQENSAAAAATARAQFLDLYVPLAAEIGPAYTKMLLPTVSRAIRSGDYGRSYVPVGVFRKVLHMHATFLRQLGVAGDTFLASYLHYLDRIENEKHGPAAWTDLAIAENKTPTTTSSTTNDGDGDSMDEDGESDDEL